MTTHTFTDCFKGQFISLKLTRSSAMKCSLIAGDRLKPMLAITADILGQ